MAAALATVQGAVGGVLLRAVLALPRPLLALLAGRPPSSVPELEPEAWLLARLGTATRALRAEEDDAPAARERFAIETAMVAARLRLPVETSDVTAAGLPARLSVPHGLAAPAPLLVFFHGGGWVIGSAATHEPACR